MGLFAVVSAALTAGVLAAGTAGDLRLGTFCSALGFRSKKAIPEMEWVHLRSASFNHGFFITSAMPILILPLPHVSPSPGPKYAIASMYVGPMGKFSFPFDR
jgi:hypothetical protein